MAYVTIDSNIIKVGDPITKELIDLVKSNLDDLDSRVQTLGTGSGKISLMNQDIHIGSTGTPFLTGAIYIEVIQACIITEGAIQIFDKASATTGILTIDVKKNTTTNPSGFNTVFTSGPTLNMAVAANYTRNAGTIDAAAQSLAVGDILRLDITSLPTGLQKFRIVLIGEF